MANADAHLVWIEASKLGPAIVERHEKWNGIAFVADRQMPKATWHLQIADALIKLSHRLHHSAFAAVGLPVERPQQLDDLVEGQLADAVQLA